MKRLLILLLMLIPSTSLLASDAPYDFSFAEIVDYERIELEEGLYYEYFDFISSGNANKAFHAVMDPKSDKVEMVLHDVYPSMGEFQSATVSQIAADFEASTGRKVYAAVNGDFFWNHAPIDYYIKEGQVWQEGWHDEKEAFGFNRQGDFAIGTPELDSVLRLGLTGQITFQIDRTENQAPYPGEIAIYRPGGNMFSIESSKYLVKATPETIDNDYTFPLEGTIVYGPDQPVLTDEAVEVPPGYFGIVVNGMAGNTTQAEAFHEAVYHGMPIRAVRGPVGEFDGIDYVIGGNNILVENGVVMPYELKTSSAGQYWQPRTSIGVNTDGTFFISVFDGRDAGYASGLTVPQQAQFAYDLGAHTALELDGGGSSTFVLRIDDALQVVNRPSDGVERRVTNAVLIVEALEEPTPPDHDDDTDDTDDQDSPDDTDNGSDGSDETPRSDEDEGGSSNIVTAVILGSLGLLFGGAFFIIAKKPF